MNEDRRIAYFSMEIGLTAEMPTYSGGLGVLAGDTLKAAADLRVPLVAVTLLYHKGYLRQKLDAHGQQSDEPIHWPVADMLKRESTVVTVTVEGRPVKLTAWTLMLEGVSGFKIPIHYLDSRLKENSDYDQTLTDALYGGDQRYRLCQEILLGVGGVRMLRALGYRDIERFHMNEGHAALLTLELLRERMASEKHSEPSADDREFVRSRCVFTTHTPVPAGHDRFAKELVGTVLDEDGLTLLKSTNQLDNELNMTHLAMHLSRYANGVARRHGEVSRKMFAPNPVDHITNGIHASSWASPPFRALFDRYVPGWREDNTLLRYMLACPGSELWAAHQLAKARCLEYVLRKSQVSMQLDTFTIGFARRAATYKRADLLFHDIERLRRIAREAGPLQVIYAGKSHPADEGGKQLIRNIYAAKERLKDLVKVVYLEDYDIEVCKLMSAGVDLWLNNPEPPLEASGTSGMKAALNGIPSLSTVDGWWVEGGFEGLTGWLIGNDEPSANERNRDATIMYEKLQYVVLPMYYHQRDHFLGIMRNCIALNGSYFNTQRMMQEYVVKAYTMQTQIWGQGGRRG